MTHNNLDRSQIHYAKQRKRGTKTCMHSEGFHFMTFWERHKFRSGEQISDFPGITWIKDWVLFEELGVQKGMEKYSES